MSWTSQFKKKISPSATDSHLENSGKTKMGLCINQIHQRSSRSSSVGTTPLPYTDLDISGSALHQTRPMPVPVSQPEHLRGLLHHLLGPAPPLRGLAAVGGTGPVLRHGLGGVCASSRSSQSCLGPVLGRIQR